MAKQLDFIGIGNVAYDFVLTVDDFPATGGKYLAHSADQFPGGFIANATCAASRLGLDCAYVGWIGDDSGGKLLQEGFTEFGVKNDALAVIDGEPTAFTMILVDSSGDRVILLPPSNLYHQVISQQQIEWIRRAKVIYTHPRDTAWCQQLIDITRESDTLLALDVE